MYLSRREGGFGFALNFERSARDDQGVVMERDSTGS